MATRKQARKEPEGHVALVTGASGGIGAAIARALARTGATVVAAARDRERCAALCADIEGEGGVAHPVRLDVTDPASVEAAVSEARHAHGHLDWLVNNAGIAVSAPLLSVAPRAGELARRHMEVNFHGARRVIEALLGDMVERRYGRIVNVASSAGLRGYAYVSGYCASKFALVGYTLAAARELEGKGVSVNAVCPHYVDSPMTDEAARRIAAKTGKGEDEARAFLAGENPGGRLVAPEEVADAVRWLIEGEENGKLVELDGSRAASGGAAR